MEKSHIVSVPCQEDPDLAIMNLTCTDKFKDIKFIQHIDVSVMAVCPPPEDCGEAPDVEGNVPAYSDNTQVCKAALHAGKMIKTGDNFLITMKRASSRVKKFQGGTKEGVASAEVKSKDEQPSFQLDEVEILCPQEA